MFQGLWPWGLANPRFTHQRFASWWTDTGNLSCHLLFLWHSHQQGGILSAFLIGQVLNLQRIHYNVSLVLVEEDLKVTCHQNMQRRKIARYPPSLSSPLFFCFVFFFHVTRIYCSAVAKQKFVWLVLLDSELWQFHVCGILLSHSF